MRVCVHMCLPLFVNGTDPGLEPKVNRREEGVSSIACVRSPSKLVFDMWLLLITL